MATISRRLPLHQAFVRPLLVAGGEREATFLVWFVCLSIPILISLWYVPIGLVVGAAGQSFLRGLAKKDPQALGVVRRHWSQQTFYPGRASAYAPVRYRAPKEQTQSAASMGVMKILAKLMGGKK
ncbi:VirB3 family type IV secretion system protein [Acidithiobacillus montserratensis]|uniref:VirB3 family type IV secretion system protein n=1 Tax=Acidithiobacillus montserratensis TaxID=2729135 RepID=A0ACD5HL58_9PROT|nr:VirB3 family type IV secretion system protein [Acidithiobacillus montserratensis]MBU2747852.1 conjugal transfer protein TrbD [Acidithiobacillus montserratensis]